MRLWSLNPKYLDTKGLVALWREGLLAKAVLENKTKGYKNHPQLERFKKHKAPVKAINTYLHYVYLEAQERGYNFDKKKIKYFELTEKIIVTEGQIEHEKEHLLKKLKIRDNIKMNELVKEKNVLTHPFVKTKKGKIEDWEILKEKK